MTWKPNLVQQAARLDPDAEPDAEAKARVLTAITLLGHWIDRPDPALLAASSDMIECAIWWCEAMRSDDAP